MVKKSYTFFMLCCSTAILFTIIPYYLGEFVIHLFGNNLLYFLYNAQETVVYWSIGTLLFVCLLYGWVISVFFDFLFYKLDSKNQVILTKQNDKKTKDKISFIVFKGDSPDILNTQINRLRYICNNFKINNEQEQKDISLINVLIDDMEDIIKNLTTNGTIN